MENQENELSFKKEKIIKHSLRDDILNIIEPELKETSDFLKAKLERLNDFSTENEVLDSLAAYLPKTVLVGKKSFDFHRMMKFDGFFSYLIFHSVNQFYSYLFGKGLPFNGSVEESNNSLGKVEFNFIALEEDYLERLEYIIPIVLKNFKIFETIDVLRKNAAVIKKIDVRKINDIAFFINEKGEFENIHSFVLNNKELIVNMPSSVFGVDVMNKIDDKITEMENSFEEIMELKKLKDEIGDGVIEESEAPENDRHQIIKTEDINKIFQLANSSDAGSAEHERASIVNKYESLTEGAEIVFAKKEMLIALEELKERFPNFSDVIDYLKGSVSLSLLKENTGFYFEPIVLLGSPGLGKTAFSKALGKALSIRSEVWAVSQFNQGFTLSGLDMGWASGKPGKIMTCMAKNNIANPIILLDELDKTPSGIGNGAAGVDSILLQLFEKETSSEFIDEAMDVPVNASLINWICTANDISEISGPLLSRLKIFNIKKPTSRQMPAIIDSIYKKLLSETRVGDCFEEELPNYFYNILSEYEPRKVHKILKDAMRYTAQHIVSSGGYEGKLSIDDLAFKSALKHEPNQRQKNITSI